MGKLEFCLLLSGCIVFLTKTSYKRWLDDKPVKTPPLNLYPEGYLSGRARQTNSDNKGHFKQNKSSPKSFGQSRIATPHHRKWTRLLHVLAAQCLLWTLAQHHAIQIHQIRIWLTYRAKKSSSTYVLSPQCHQVICEELPSKEWTRLFRVLLAVQCSLQTSLITQLWLRHIHNGVPMPHSTQPTRCKFAAMRDFFLKALLHFSKFLVNANFDLVQGAPYKNLAKHMRQVIHLDLAVDTFKYDSACVL